MKRVWFCLPLILVSGAIASFLYARANASKETTTLSLKPVRDFSVEGYGLLQVISVAQAEFGLRFGIEFCGQTARKPISIHVQNGTVATVLNSLVGQVPSCAWSETNGVIDLMPQQNRDSLLEVKIAHFRVEDAPEWDIRSAILSRPEVQAWLSRNHVKERSIFGEETFRSPLVSLATSDTTLRSLLNQTLTKSAFKTWLVARYGSKNEYLQMRIN